MTLKEYQKAYTEEDAVGWLAIDEQIDKFYRGQEPKHFVNPVPYSLGGENPLDGISIYESKKQIDHFHFVTYGFSELYYNEESAGREFSKFGFELTFRLKKYSEDDNLNWAYNLLQNLAKYVFKSKKWFEEFHVIPANGPIRLNYETELTAVAFIIDPEFGIIETPNGQVQFLQMVGLTTAEYEEFKLNPVLSETEKIIQRLKVGNELLITDLDRK